MDENFLEKCGICFKILTSTDSRILDGTLLDFFETLLIKLSVDPSKTVYICTDCEEKVNNSFNFKCLCIGTEDTISPYFGVEKVDLKSIVSYQETQENSYYEGLEVCRLCKNFVSCESVVSLITILEDESLKEIFEKHIPEINLEATESPVICQHCQEYLINFANLLFLLFSYKEDTNLKSDYKNSVLKRVKGETNSYCTETGKLSLNKIKAEQSDNNLNENIVEYTIKQEIGKNIELPEVQFKTEDVHDSFENNGSTTAVLESNNINGSSANKHLISTVVVKPKVYKCSECRYETHSLNNLVEHTRSHTEQSRPLFHKCKICGFTTRQPYLLKLHIQEHNKTIAKKNNCNPTRGCAKCAFETNDLELLRAHIEQHKQLVIKKNEGRVIMKHCPECSFESSNSSEFGSHLLTHPNYYIKKVVPTAGGTSLAKNARTQPKRLVYIGKAPSGQALKKMFKCELCQYTGSNYQDFRNHVLTHVKPNTQDLAASHNLSTEFIHYCELCDFRTLCLDDLKNHIEVHMKG